MSIVASEIIIYGSANIAESDGSTHGGAIDTAVRYVFDDATLANTLNEAVNVLSDDAVDTSQTYTVTGRNAGGAIISDAISLNGITAVSGVETFERILKTEIDIAHNGNITLRRNSDDTTILITESGVLDVRRPFYDVSADAAGGSSRDFYEKLFIKNTNAVNIYLTAIVIENADPSGKVTFNLEDVQEGTESIADRLNTAPVSVSASFDNANKAVPGVDLGSLSGIGCWLKLTLAAGDAAQKTTYTLQTTGNTT